MSLPTDGFDTSSVNYTMATSSGLALKATIDTNSPERREAAEVFLPMLEEALDLVRTRLRDEAQTQTFYIERTYGASIRDTL